MFESFKDKLDQLFNCAENVSLLRIPKHNRMNPSLDSHARVTNGKRGTWGFHMHENLVDIQLNKFLTDNSA